MNGDDAVEGSTDLPDLSGMSLDELRTTTDWGVLKAVMKVTEEAQNPPAEPEIRFDDQ